MANRWIGVPDNRRLELVVPTWQVQIRSTLLRSCAREHEVRKTMFQLRFKPPHHPHSISIHHHTVLANHTPSSPPHHLAPIAPSPPSHPRSDSALPSPPPCPNTNLPRFPPSRLPSPPSCQAFPTPPTSIPTRIRSRAESPQGRLQLWRPKQPRRRWPATSPHLLSDRRARGGRQVEAVEKGQ